MSERSDPLSYGKNRQCFIQQIEQISVSSWGEVTTTKYIGIEGFFSCLTNVFNNSQPPISTQQLTLSCYIPTRAKSITLRIEVIFANLVKIFSGLSIEQNNRYIIANKRSYTIFQKRNNFLLHQVIDSKEQLFQELSKPQDFFSPVHFDKYVLEDTPIPYLYTLNKAQIIQVFYLKENTNTLIYIIDEKGTLFIHKHQQSNPNHILRYYSIFLESLLIHTLYNDIDVKFYEIQKNSAGILSSHSANWDSKTAYIDLSLRIIMEELPSKTAKPIYYIYCNDIEFTSIIHGNQIFEVVSNSIMAFRKNKENYPIHITEIDVPCSFLGVENDSQLQTIHFLNYKKKIETKLNI
jgi:adenylate cyclase class 1